MAAVAPAVSVAGTDANAEAIIQTAAVVAASGAELAVFPELSITAYTCGDLFHSSTLFKLGTSCLGKNYYCVGIVPYNDNGGRHAVAGKRHVVQLCRVPGGWPSGGSCPQDIFAQLQ